MATSPTPAGHKPANGKKSTVKRQNKPRTFYMAYQGELTAEPTFVFDKDELVDKMLENRDLKVKRITVPVSKRGKQEPATGPDTAVPTA